MRALSSKALTSVVGGLILTGVACGQGAGYAFQGAAFTASAEELKAASATMPVDHEFGAQILFEEGSYKTAADGTLKYQHRLVYRVDAPGAVEGWSEISSSWDPWYENPAQLHARVLTADGRFVTLDQKTVTDAPIKGDDASTFSSERVRRAPLPGVAVGYVPNWNSRH